MCLKGLTGHIFSSFPRLVFAYIFHIQLSQTVHKPFTYNVCRLSNAHQPVALQCLLFTSWRWASLNVQLTCVIYCERLHQLLRGHQAAFFLHVFMCFLRWVTHIRSAFLPRARSRAARTSGRSSRSNGAVRTSRPLPTPPCSPLRPLAPPHHPAHPGTAQRQEEASYDAASFRRYSEAALARECTGVKMTFIVIIFGQRC